jgi:predicted XRE-type DNA-binding protein
MLPDVEVIYALRSDVAHQIARYTTRLGVSQLVAARKLDVPQPTLSKIVNSRTSDLSLELLLRIAIRAGIRLTLQTGPTPLEAGAFVSGVRHASLRARQSSNADLVHARIKDSIRQLSPSQRLEAFLEHSQLLSELHSAGREAILGRHARTTQDGR